MSPRALLLFAAAEGSKDKWCEAEVHRIAQGMFWRENVNEINEKMGLCPSLCRDPPSPQFFNNLSVEATRGRYGRPMSE